jgi:ADP-heptose:LPS heptosyltransferase
MGLILKTADSATARQGRLSDKGRSQKDFPVVPSIKTLVDLSLLHKAKKVLFIAHLALGDYAYLQSCFIAFKRAFPDVLVDLWVDERRRTKDSSQWKHLQKYALYDWLDESACFNKIYTKTYSPAAFQKSVCEAQQEDYQVVVSLATLERHKYALLARKISPAGFVVGQKKRVRVYDIAKHVIYRKLDAFIPAHSESTHPGQHISSIYASWFTLLFGLEIPASERFPVVNIPIKWAKYAERQFLDWGFKNSNASDVIFLNSFSKSPERTWPVQRLLELITVMRATERWKSAFFIINVVPEEMDRVENEFKGQSLQGIQLFTAQENFFQLPAILGMCRLVISVETAVMHLANAVHVPVIALMRQKTPEWAPLDTANSTVITVAKRDDHLDRLGVADVMDVLVKRGIV